MSVVVVPRDTSHQERMRMFASLGMHLSSQRHEEKLFNALGPDRAAKREEDLARANFLKEQTRLMEGEQRRQWIDSVRQMQAAQQRDFADSLNAMEDVIKSGNVTDPKALAAIKAKWTSLKASRFMNDDAATMLGVGAGAESIARSDLSNDIEKLIDGLGKSISTLPQDQATNVDALRGVLRAFGEDSDLTIGREIYKWGNQYQEQAGGVLNGLVLSSEEKPTWFGMSSKEVPITAKRVFTEVDINKVLGDLDFLKTFAERLRDYSVNNKSNAADSLLGITLRLARQQGIDLAKTDPEDEDSGAPEYVKNMMRENRGGALSQDTDADEVMMISPDGQRGYVPRANMQKAVERGYRIAE